MAHPSSNEQSGLSMRDSNTAMPGSVAGVGASVGFYSDIGSRKQNDDFAGAVLGAELPTPRQDVVAAIADGIGSTKGGSRRGRDNGARLPRRILRAARDLGGKASRGEGLGGT
jgi:hypothetical protein